MKVCCRAAIIPALLFFTAILSAQANCVLSNDEFIKDWSQTKQFTLDVANAMPAEFYSFKPTPQEMTFGEQMLHIARANMFTFRQFSGVPSPFSLDHNLDPSNREAVIKLLQKSFDYVLSVLPQLNDQKLQKKIPVSTFKGRSELTGRDMIMNMFVHTAHHRAQSEVYLRLKGITPPIYTF
jgi:uncharacterized damage-inducible protein DinB